MKRHRITALVRYLFYCERVRLGVLFVRQPTWVLDHIYCQALLQLVSCFDYTNLSWLVVVQEQIHRSAKSLKYPLMLW